MSKAMKKYRKVLAIAGTDSGGGAGIPADIKAISACGCYAECAITAVTAQDTTGVSSIHDIPPEIIKEQIIKVIGDIGADSIKIGMLSNASTVTAVAEALEECAKGIPTVLDPVMVSTSGHSLLKPDAIEALTGRLMPLAAIITPNIPEAEALLGIKINGAEYLEDCAKRLSGIAGNSVLLKGGHLEDGDELTDILYNSATGKTSSYSAPRLLTPNTHGTGCTMSSALAAFLANGESMEDAVAHAKEYLYQAIRQGAEYQIGHGHGPVKHFWEFWGSGK